MENLNDAIDRYNCIENEFKKKEILKPGEYGGLIFAGNYWPNKNGKIDPIKEHDVRFAFDEARKISLAYTACKAAILNNNEDHVIRMEKWFGKRNHCQQKDWWLGVSYILGAIETHILKNLNIYYRGDNSLIDQPNDYPNAQDNLTNYDIIGFAESATLVQNNVIGLCEEFFEKNKNGSMKVNLKGRDSIGGVLIHELSHNICGTEDHEVKPNVDAYGEENCVELAKNNPELAWYNADNIEYFFEDVIYNI